MDPTYGASQACAPRPEERKNEHVLKQKRRKRERGKLALPFGQAHLGDLLARYSAPVMVLDLTKQTEKREREMIVSHEFRRAIEHARSAYVCESFPTTRDAMKRFGQERLCIVRGRETL